MDPTSTNGAAASLGTESAALHGSASFQDTQDGSPQTSREESALPSTQHSVQPSAQPSTNVSEHALPTTSDNAVPNTETPQSTNETPLPAPSYAEAMATKNITDTKDIKDTSNGAPKPRRASSDSAVESVDKVAAGGGDVPPPDSKSSEKAVSFFGLWRYSDAKLRALVVLGCFMRLASGALSPCAFIVLGSILNDFGSDTNFFTMPPHQFAAYLRDNNIDLIGQFRPSILKLVYLGIGLYVAQYIGHVCIIFSSDLQANHVRELYSTAILRQEIGWHDKAEEGSLVTRLALDTQIFQDGTAEHVGESFHAIAAFIAGIIIAFVHSWKMAFVMISVLPLLLGIGAILGRTIQLTTRKTQDAFAHAGRISEQAIYGIRTVFAFNLQHRFIRIFNDRLRIAEKWDRLKGVVFSLGVGCFFFILYEIFALAFWYGSKLVRRGEITGGDVLVTFFSMLIGVMSLITVPTAMQHINSARGAAFKIYAVIENVPNIDPYSDKGHKAETVKGQIELKNVVFAYPARPDVNVLKNVSLTIPFGANVAFVGASGSGKSTIVSLLQRWYDILEGSLTLDGVELREWNVSNLREHIGLVGQEPVLFNMSVRDNILMGSKNSVSEERLIEVCKMANCHSFIETFPHGYDTNVGEHGGMMSGGQKQRIAIARALIKDPQILLLDEATSALDTASERIVQRALDVASKNRTTITVAHRLSTIRNCTCIYVVGNGNIIEAGTHDELIALRGTYYELSEKQRIKQLADRKGALSAPNANGEPGSQTERLSTTEDAPKEELSAPVAAAEADDAVITTKKVIYGEDGKIRLPNKAEMTAVSTAARKRELKQISKMRKESKPFFEYFLRIMRVVREMRYLFAIGAVFAVVAGGVSPAVSTIMAHDVVLLLSPDIKTAVYGGMDGPNKYSFLLCMMGIAAFLGFFIKIFAFEILAAKLTRRLRVLLFASLIRKDCGFFDEEGHGTGTITAKLASDCADVTLMVSRAWNEMIQFAGTMVMGLVLSFCYAPNITGIILLIAPLITFAAVYRSRAFRGYESKTKKAYEEASETAAEAIKEIRTVAALDRQTWFTERYSASLVWLHSLSISRAFKDAVAVAFNGSANMFTSAIAFYGGVRLITNGHISFPDMFVSLMIITNTAQALGNSATFTSTFLKGQIAAITVYELIDEKVAIDPFQDGYLPGPRDDAPSFKGEIDAKIPDDEAGDSASIVNVKRIVDDSVHAMTKQEKKDDDAKHANEKATIEEPVVTNTAKFIPKFQFRDIAFKYPSRPKQKIFTGEFNLYGPENKTIALVGPSGCGKSTTIGMIQRWYEPLEGVVTVNDVNVKSYDLQALRSRMALVGQEPVLYDVSIRENISWGLPELATSGRLLSDAELEDVSRRSNIRQFINDLPQGFDTLVGDKGSQLSGGQKQRIAIARALIRNPQILLLDEATSALDSGSEKIVQAALDEAAKGRTTIVIAHRLSTIQDADIIAVINNGKVAEIGTHFELLSMNGIYAGLVAEQQLGNAAMQ